MIVPTHTAILCDASPESLYAERGVTSFRVSGALRVFQHSLCWCSRLALPARSSTVSLLTTLGGSRFLCSATVGGSSRPRGWKWHSGQSRGARSRRCSRSEERRVGKEC